MSSEKITTWETNFATFVIVLTLLALVLVIWIESIFVSYVFLFY
ncbi:hypothetical protein NT05LI_1179 [Listeria ivanovii FSL F6-596]|nr:hypothetical protein NT05LI_1179 [Listeria ivanovii FSL F6-596]